MKNKIFEFRTKNGLTQRQLANELGMLYQALQRYERGSVVPPVYVAIRLARVLHTTVEELFPIEEE